MSIILKYILQIIIIVAILMIANLDRWPSRALAFACSYLMVAWNHKHK